MIRKSCVRNLYGQEKMNKIKNITLINIKSSRMLGAYGFLAKIFDIFAKYEKSVDVISTSEVSVSLSIDDDKNINEI